MVAKDQQNKIRALEAENKRLKRLVYVDELTGALNRRGFLKAANGIFQAVSGTAQVRERRKNNAVFSSFGVAFLDLDGLKKINDTFGHEAGDKLLSHISRVLVQTVRSYDLVARWGGDEFVILLLGVSRSGATKATEKIKQAVSSNPLPFKGELLQVSASIGLTVFNVSQHKSLQQMLEQADKAMYFAKTHGKNSVKLSA